MNIYHSVFCAICAITIQLLCAQFFLSVAHAQTVVFQEPMPLGLAPDNSDQTGGGDGYIPIPFADRIYIINHHILPGGLTGTNFRCLPKTPGSTACSDAGFVDGRLPDGMQSGPALFSTTSHANEEYEIVGGRYLIYPVTRFLNNQNNTSNAPMDWGVGCFDLTISQECGFLQLSNGGLSPGNPNGRSYDNAIEGPFTIGNNHYFLDLEMQLSCVTIDPITAAMSTCQGVDLFAHPSALLPLFQSNLEVQMVAGLAANIAGEVVGEKAYLSIIYNNDGSPGQANNLLLTPAGSTVTDTGGVVARSVGTGRKYVICIDTSLPVPTPCWTQPSLMGTAEYEANRSNFLAYTSSGGTITPDSFCAFNNGIDCVSLATGVDTSNSWTWFDTEINNQAGQASPIVTGGSLGSEVVLGLESYFPRSGTDVVFCVDWSSQTSCQVQPIEANPSDLRPNFPPLIWRIRRFV